MPVNPQYISMLLAALASIGPFAIDTYLPAFRAVAEGLGASQLQVQQTLTTYMATYAVMSLWHGALSDRFGRRNVIIVATSLFALASLVCAFATSIEWLWLGRAMQGMAGGAGMIVGRAVIRDLFEGAHAQRAMSRVMMFFAVAPAVAPIVGGVLLELAGWRSIFVFLAGYALLLVWLTWRHLPETLPAEGRHSLHPVKLGRAYLTVASSWPFLLLVIAVGMNFNGFFIYVMSTPQFLMTHLGLGETEFAWFFVPVVAGMMFGSMLSGKLAGRLSPKRTIFAGFAIMLLAALLNVLHAASTAPTVLFSVFPVALYVCGMSIAMPSLTLLALDLFPQRKGLASSCQSFVQIGINTVCAGIVAPLMWGSILMLAIAMSLFVAAGLVLFMFWQRRVG